MPNYLEILRLDSLNHSQRTIESTMHCSRHTVRSILQATKEKQIIWPLDALWSLWDHGPQPDAVHGMNDMGGIS